MFQWFSGKRRRDRRLVVDTIYEEIVAAARRPGLYSRWQVPDTPLGRFEMLSLHLFLVLHRLRGRSGGLDEIAQELTDHFFLEVDHSLRELGIGDMGVPKRMKKLARMFYGRVQSYDEALEAGDSEALAKALTRNIAPGSDVWPGADALSAYTFEARAALDALDDDALLGGRLRFAALPREEMNHG